MTTLIIKLESCKSFEELNDLARMCNRLWLYWNGGKMLIQGSLVLQEVK